jgi:hypothetical protein
MPRREAVCQELEADRARHTAATLRALLSQAASHRLSVSDLLGERRASGRRPSYVEKLFEDIAVEVQPGRPADGMLLTLSLRSHKMNGGPHEQSGYYHDFRQLAEALWTKSNTLLLGHRTKGPLPSEGEPPLIEYTLTHAESRELEERINLLVGNLEHATKRQSFWTPGRGR